MALLTEDEEGMKSMMARFERYLDEKGLELNTEKMKVMSFKKEEEEGRGESSCGREEK